MNNHWKQVTLSEICSVSAGNSAPQDPSYFAEGTIPFFRTSDAGRVKFGTIYESQDKLNAHGASKLRRYPAGTILFPKSGASTFLNHRVVLGVEGCVSSHLATIVPDLSHVLPQFLLYALTIIDAKDLIQDQSYPSLNLPAIEKIRINLPPLTDQERIARQLDEALEGITIAKSNAEKNLQNARALFDSQLQSVFSQQGKSWKQKRLGDIVTRLTNGYVGPTRNIYQESGIPYLLARHVRNNQLQFDGKTYISEEFNQKNSKSMLKFGDVLLVQSGHIGHSAVVSEEHSGHNCHAMIVITAAEGTFIGKYLSLYFNSAGMKKKFQAIKSGSTVPHLTCGEIRELDVPLPDLVTQFRIVAECEELDANVQVLVKVYERKLADLSTLKESLLQQAFSGNWKVA